MVIKAIVFDIGGVLVRTRSWEIRQKWELELNLNKGDLDKIVFESKVAQEATIGKASYEDVWKDVKNVLGLDEVRLRALQSDFWAEDFLDKELFKVFCDLPNKYYKVILSNIWSGGRKFLEKNYGIFEGKQVKRVFLSYELGLAKPDPKIFNFVRQNLDVNFQDILFIDDSEINIEAAKNLGIRAHLFFQNRDMLLRFIESLK